MWHGEVGHWVINDTPGEHGNDLVMSELDDFALPNEVTWKDSGDMVVSDEAPFVKPEFYGPETIYVSENPGESLDGEWTLSDSTYDGYPYYENADESMFMYWEWQTEGSNMGQWMIDGHLMKSELSEFAPPHLANWDYTSEEWDGTIVSDKPPFVPPPFYGPEELWISESPEGTRDGKYYFLLEDDGETQKLWEAYPMSTNGEGLNLLWRWYGESGQWFMADDVYEETYFESYPVDGFAPPTEVEWQNND